MTGKKLSYHLSNKRRGKRFQRQMRRHITKPEKILFSAMEKAGIWFIHQPAYYNHEHLYLPDFLIKIGGKKVLIEVDGLEHRHKRESGYEHKRWFWLARNRGISRILRFANKRVLSEVDSVVAEVMSLRPAMITPTHGI